MGRNKYLTVDASGTIISGRKQRRRVSMPTDGERMLFKMVMEKGIARMIVGDEGAALNTKQRLRDLLAQHSAGSAMVVAVRSNDVICWSPELYNSRRLNTKIEDAAYREENTITCSVWSAKGFEKSRGNLASLAGDTTPVSKIDQKSVGIQVSLDWIKGRLEKGDITQEQYEEKIAKIMKQSEEK